jgi:CHAT domain-containing protein/predicted negative regulator of RcsB-dependent stress response
VSGQLHAQQVSDSITVKRYIKTSDSLGDLGMYEQALPFIQKSVEYYSKPVSPEKLVRSLTKESLLYIRLGWFDAADSLLQKALKIDISTNAMKAVRFSTRGEFQLNKGRSTEAMQDFQKALALFQLTEKASGREIAKCYSDIGLTCWNTGNIDLGLEYQLKSLQLRKELFGNNHPETAASYNNIGLMYTQQNPQIALDYYQKALDIYLLLYKQNHPSIAICLNNIAFIQKQQGNTTEALRNFQKVSAIWQTLYKDKKHPNEGFVLNNIGQIYAEKGNYEQALSQFFAALYIYNSYFGKKHPELAQIYNQIGGVYLKQGNVEAAITAFQEALCANLPDFDKEDTYATPPLKNYYNANLLLVSLSLKAKALEEQYTNKTLNDKDLFTSLYSLQVADSLVDIIRKNRRNKSDKIALSAQVAHLYEQAVQVCFQLSQVTLRKSYYLEKAFYYSEKSKAAVLLEAISETEAKQFADIPLFDLEKERQFRTDLTFYEQKLSEVTSKETEKTYRNKLFALNREYDAFVSYLETSYPRYFNLKYNTKTVTLKEVQHLLDPHTALVSYLLAEERERMYIFYISRSHYQVYDVPLDSLSYKMTHALRNAITYKNEELFRISSSHLFKQLFPFRLKKKITTLTVIPDGMLGTLPFEVLLSKKVKKDKNYPYLLKHCAISYCYSSTLYSQIPTPSASSQNSALLCAPIQFDYPTFTLPQLSSSSEEIRSLDYLFKASGISPKQLISDKADELSFKTQDLSNYRFIHLATHGVVNEENPDLSRIFLSYLSNSKEDGQLYAGELYNLSLKADLVTLSACETGLGKVVKGEGIIGLSRALLYAGANNLLVSLWRVSDKSTSLLMVEFYKQLLNGQKKPQALRLAKLSLISSLEKELAGSEAPHGIYYWSPFILIGK